MYPIGNILIFDAIFTRWSTNEKIVYCVHEGLKSDT